MALNLASSSGQNFLIITGWPWALEQPWVTLPVKTSSPSSPYILKPNTSLTPVYSRTLTSMRSRSPAVLLRRYFPSTSATGSKSPAFPISS